MFLLWLWLKVSQQLVQVVWTALRCYNDYINYTDYADS